MPLKFKGANSFGNVPTIVDAFGAPLTFTIEVKFKFIETGTGPFRHLVRWGGEEPLATKGFCFGLDPEGHLQFEAFEEAGLPGVPTLMGVMPTTGGIPTSTTGGVRQVRVHGDYAFASSGTGVTVVDISNETVLTMVATLPVIMNCQNLALSADGTKAVLTGSRQYYDEAGAIVAVNCLYVVDVSVPTSPRLLGQIETADFNFLEVALSGTYAYVACAGAGVKIVNLSNPVAPFVENTYPTSNANAVTVAGDYAYVSDGLSGLIILNISTPTSPMFSSTYDTPGAATMCFVSGSLAYVADGNSVQIIDVSNPAIPVFKSSLPQRKAIYVSVKNGIAYVADPLDGLVLWDVTNPASPTYINALVPTAPGQTIAVCLDPADTSKVYCANVLAGLAMVRTSPIPPHPTKLASVAEWFGAAKVAVRGDLMIASGTRVWNGGQSSSAGLRLLRNRAAPYEVGKFDTATFNCSGIAISSSGLYAYVAATSFGVKVFDISNLAAPTVVATYNSPGFANAIALSGNYLYLADNNSGLVILDVTTPTEPVEVKVFDTPGSAKNLVVVGTKVYVADNTSLKIIDVTTPTEPVTIGTYPTPQTCLDVAVNGNTAYLALSTLGVKIVDVTDPGDIQPLGTLPQPTGINPTTVSVAVAGTKVCMANAASGLSIWNAADPEVPVLLATLFTSGNAQDVIMDDGWAYVAPSAGTINTFYLA